MVEFDPIQRRCIDKLNRSTTKILAVSHDTADLFFSEEDRERAWELYKRSNFLAGDNPFLAKSLGEELDPTGAQILATLTEISLRLQDTLISD